MESKNINEFTIRGRIVNKYRKDPFMILTLGTVSGGERRDFPKVMLFDKDLIEKADKAFAVGDFVTTYGLIQTSKRYRTQTFVCNKIEETPRVFDEFGLEGKGRHMEDVNEIKLRGKFVRVFLPESSNGNIALVTLRVETDGYTNFPSVTCFGAAAKRASELKENDDVCFIGQAQTHRVQSGDETKYYESAVGSIMPE